jgi:flagellar basal body rod protein FlgG
MDNGVYTAASGLMVAQQRLDIISHNLANLSTSGYRPQRPFAEVLEHLSGSPAGGVRLTGNAVALAGTYEPPGRGQLRATGRNLDVALPDGVYLTVQTAAGKRYTRAGDLQSSPDGYLTDARGHRLLDGKGKPIESKGRRVEVAPNGEIRHGKAVIGRFGLVRDPSGVLVREQAALLSARGADAELKPATDAVLEVGWLEGSGTNPLQELVSMIEAQRAFERLQKLISLTANEIDRRAVNDLAG